MKHIPLLLLGLLATPALSQQAADPERLASDLVARMRLQPGERVLIVAIPGESDALIPALRRRIAAARATDLGVLAATGEPEASWSTDFTRSAPKDQARLAAYLASVDLAVMMPGVGGAPAYAAMQDVLRLGKGRTIHFHWAGAYALDGSILSMTPERASVYERVLRDTDYRALAAIQAEFERAARSAPIRVTTAAGTDLTFRLGDRPVTKQDGDASAARARLGRNLIDREVELPAGAIRVAPVEETVNGRIAFPPGVWGGERVEGLVMQFVNGRVTGITARQGAAAVESELSQAGNGGRSFREFALGFNPLLTISDTGEKWIPYYGYGAGVVRLSLGDNSELGGRVGGGYVRWNFFTDATVTIGDETWVSGGKLIRGSR
ncbi:MAG TPA: aminopeptidase, partial [Gemmatimonadaceae bacterium]